ncbi:hypothetical protein ACFQJC_10765 [Haloferax namakaokahaiae]|uniref:Cox cluster protein n=1 Tax=Haloferax namakaokahaiae TaxID=1748331 RepID=A0ABD5ZFQ4_9EURY
MVVLAQTGPEQSGSILQFVVALVFFFGAFPAVYLLGRLFDRVF